MNDEGTFMFALPLISLLLETNFSRFLFLFPFSHSVSSGSSSTLLLVISLVLIVQELNINLWSGNLKVENYPLNSIKGKICTQTFINEFENQEENVDMILKPKFILYTTGNEKVQKIQTEYFFNFSGIFIIGIIIWCTVAAQRMAQAHPIKKYRRHLLTMKSHCVLACSFGL